MTKTYNDREPEFPSGSIYHAGQDNHHFLEWVQKYIMSLTNRKFYGKLTLSFESGKVTTCKLEETLKPDF